jgi:DNA-binding CsgD family transcriptional regulator
VLLVRRLAGVLARGDGDVAAAGGERAAIGSKGLEVAITGRDGSRFAAHVLPLAPGAPIDGRGKVAVFIHPAALDTAAGPGLVGSAFELTPAEQRVLAHIVEAGSVAEAAERMRLSEATVKTHLQHIFSKTGTARQAELVRLVAGFVGPLRR